MSFLTPYPQFIAQQQQLQPASSLSATRQASHPQPHTAPLRADSRDASLLNYDPTTYFTAAKEKKILIQADGIPFFILDSDTQRDIGWGSCAPACFSFVGVMQQTFQVFRTEACSIVHERLREFCLLLHKHNLDLLSCLSNRLLELGNTNVLTLFRVVKLFSFYRQEVKIFDGGRQEWVNATIYHIKIHPRRPDTVTVICKSVSGETIVYESRLKDLVIKMDRPRESAEKIFPQMVACQQEADGLMDGEKHLRDVTDGDLADGKTFVDGKRDGEKKLENHGEALMNMERLLDGMTLVDEKKNGENFAIDEATHGESGITVLLEGSSIDGWEELGRACMGELD